MRVLVVGTVPPPGGAAARQLAEVAAAHIEDGDSVTVLSPDARSAAHRSADLDGLRMAFWLVALSRRHDALELRLQANAPLVPTANRLRRTVTLLALGLALSLYKSVVVRLDSPIPLPGGVGGRATQLLWRAVDVAVVANEGDREMLRRVPQLAEEQIRIEEISVVGDTPRASIWPGATQEHLRQSVLAEIRRAASDERRLRVARASLGDASSETVSAFAASGKVQPSLFGLSETFLGIARRRLTALVRR